MSISPTAAADYNERFRDMYTFSALIWNIRKVRKIDSRKIQGPVAFIGFIQELFHFNSHMKRRTGPPNLTIATLEKH